MMKTYKEWLNEKVSNYNNLTNDIIDKVEKLWDEIVKKSKKSNARSIGYNFDFKIPSIKKNKMLKKVLRINFLLYPDEFKEIDKKFIGDNFAHYRKESAWQTGVDFAIDIIFDVEIDKNKIFATLTHELTHLSQDINKSLQYYNDIDLGSIAYTKGDIKHSDSPTEKEAVLVALFELIKRNDFDNAKLYIDFGDDYFDIYDFKQFVTKAYSYGVTRQQIEDFKKYAKFNISSKNIKKMLNL